MAVMLQAGWAHGLVIDVFSSTVQATLPAGVRQTTVGTQSVADGPGLSGVVGGTRRLTVGASAIQMPGLDSVVVGILPRQTYLSLASSQGADGTLTLTYDAGGAGLGVNLSRARGLRIAVEAVDAAALPCPLTVTLTDGSSSTAATQVLTQAKKQTLQFPFTSLRGVDLSRIQRIEVAIDPSPSGDIQLGGIVTYSAP